MSIRPLLEAGVKSQWLWRIDDNARSIWMDWIYQEVKGVWRYGAGYTQHSSPQAGSPFRADILGGIAGFFRVPIGWEGPDFFYRYIVGDHHFCPNAVLWKLTGVGERLKHRDSQALGAVNDTNVNMVPASGMQNRANAVKLRMVPGSHPEDAFQLSYRPRTLCGRAILRLPCGPLE